MTTIFFCLLFPTLAQTQNLYWDVNGAGSGGSSSNSAPGIWGVNDFWNTSSAGASATRGWVSGDTAVFAAGSNVTNAYIVTVSGNQTAGGITFEEGAVTLNGGTVTLNGGATVTVNSGRSAVINSTLAGTAGLTKAGAGTLTLNGNNTFAGNLTNSAGVLILSGSNSYAGLTLLSGGTIGIGNKSALGNSTLNLAGGTFQAFDADESFANATVISANSTIGGSNALTFLGNFLQQGGSHTLSVNNTALTTFSGPTLALGDTNVARTLTLEVSGASGGLLISSTIQNGSSVAQNLSKTGSGILTLAGSNTFTGTLNFNGGTLILENDLAAGQGILEFSASGETIEAADGARTITNGLSLGVSSITFGGMDALTFTAPTALPNNNFTFNVNNSRTTFSGKVTSGNNGVTKSGTGTLAFAGANTYSGATTVKQGTLLADNTTGSATGNGDVTVNNGGTIGGTGSISGKLTLDANAAISPGDGGPGIFTTKDETWNNNVTLTVEFNDVNGAVGVGWDVLNVLGKLDLSKVDAGKITLDLVSLTPADAPGNISDFNPTLNYSWTIIETTGGLQFKSHQNIGTVVSIETDDWSNPTDDGQFAVQLSGNNVVLSFTPTVVPEPTAGALLAVGIVILFARNEFKRRRG